MLNSEKIRRVIIFARSKIRFLIITVLCKKKSSALHAVKPNRSNQDRFDD